MNVINCPFYKLSSKKNLKYLLKINSNDFFKQSIVANKISPFIDNSKTKPRLIERPDEDLKAVQKKIKNILGMIIVPDNIFSGIKKRSYVDNARFHKDSAFLYKVDISAFFPSISREAVYHFFVDDLLCSPDIAEILTNLTTIDIDQSNMKNPDEINEFITTKRIRHRNHLISGAPTSQILSYLANNKMFDELESLSKKNSTTMTIYVDDIAFSSKDAILPHFKKSVISIIQKYGYDLSSQKTKLYSRKQSKLVTGVIISQNRLLIKNSLRRKTITCMNELKENPDSLKIRQKLQGLVTATRQVDKSAYPSIRNFAFKSTKK